MIAIPHSARPRPSTSRYLGEVDSTEKVAFTVLLRPHKNAPALPNLEYWQRTPLWERKFPTEEERTSMYCSSPEDIEAVISYIKRHDMIVLDQEAASRAVVVEAPAGKIKEAFGVQLHYYEAETPAKVRHRRSKTSKEFSGPHVETHHGYDGSVHVPEVLKDIVVHVIGLDNRSFGTPGTFSGDPSFSAYLPVPRVAELYNFPLADASSQTIGIFNTTGSYQLADIQKYFSRLPAGYNTMPTIVDVPLTVGTTKYENHPDQVKNVDSHVETQEINLDIQTAATIAQGCTVNVYFAGDTEQSWITFLNQILKPASEKTEKTPTVVTSSWITWGEYDYGSAFSEKFKEMAAAGILMFGISGDWGADDNVRDGTSHVGSPSNDPSVTCCGGTVLGNIREGPPVEFDEFAWSDVNNPASAFGTTNDSGFGATGGGMSTLFDTPPYQILAGIDSFTDSAGNVKRGGRFVPDVAGMVGYIGFVINDSDWTLAGTSAVAPLYAGLFAVIKSLIGHKIGLLNPLLYQLGTSDAFRDVVVGNNDSVLPIDSPFFFADRGFDPTTGWGSINGAKMLTGIAALTIPPLPAGTGAIVGVLLGGVKVDGGGKLILPGGHVVPIDPWQWRIIAQAVTIAQISEKLTGLAREIIAGEMYRNLEKLSSDAIKALADRGKVHG